MAVISHSAGSYHYTADGRKLADFTSGVLVSNLGHNPRSWWERLMQYMKLDSLSGDGGFTDAVPLTAYNASTEIEATANERLLKSMRSVKGGDRMEQILWSASGSEAVQKALWASMARREGQDVILATRGGFHGKKGLAGAVTGSEQDKERDPRVRFISFPKDECATFQRRSEPIDLTPYRKELDELHAELGDRICCLITEPYLGGGGSYHPQPEYLQMLQAFCRERDILFILDEIQSNFGRTGEMYAYTHYGIEPDIVTLGKGMGNGIPVDAAVGRADVFSNLGFGEGSDTWSAHPIGCAAVLATLDEFESKNVLEQARPLAKLIEEKLLELTELPAINTIRGEGTVWGIECAALGDRSAEEVADEIVRLAYCGDGDGNAIHLLGPLAGKVIRIAPPLVMPLDEASAYFDALHGIIQRTA
ncbi:MAG: aspartate aminotransferase family protein [Verrucomicrobiales bacterium]|nr:aspartate aminotransferase family protein [Verrucomicrobiales bacterium]